MFNPIKRNSGLVTCLFALTMAVLAPSTKAFDSNQFYYIVNQQSGLSLDVNEASSEQGSNVIQWSYWEGAHQQWRILENGDGTYRLINRSSGQALDVAGHSAEDNANVLQWPWKSERNANQRWQINRLEDQSFSLIALHSQKALQVNNAANNNGANVVQGAYYAAGHQRWHIVPINSGTPESRLFQAESAAWLSGAVLQTEHDGFEGSAYVNFEPNEPGGFIEWQVNIERAGRYQLEFRFANGAEQARPAEIRVGEQVITRLSFASTGDWGQWHTVETTLNLSKGIRKIRLTGTGADGGANIDSLKLIWQNDDTPTDPVPMEMYGFATLNGGTTGGQGGHEVTVSNLQEFSRYAESDEPHIIYVQGIIQLPGMVSVGSNTTIQGIGDFSGFTGGGLKLRGVRNVIIRNLKLSFSRDDLIQIYDSKNIWVDHNELWNDREHHKDYYDGLLDITRGSNYVTVSWNYMHDHIKGSLVGAGDNHGEDDLGSLKVTYHHNVFKNIDSRVPSLRFGTGHFYNNLVVNVGFAINSRMGAQMLVEANIFNSVQLPIATNRYSREDGFVIARNNRYTNSGDNQITQTGNFDSTPYSYHLDVLDELSEILSKGVGVGVIQSF
ncbi:RICIN domain-containing protein [Pleionea sediminis]|uniref:pectate lyase family protein n=1 Tax=Pleionea sediminis TaxID=2569479 RepID=UPI0013DE72E8|nr:RICIN domain-containing protein [Pleionea sediminis]